MKNTKIAVSLLLVMLMLLGTFTACTPAGGNDDTTVAGSEAGSVTETDGKQSDETEGESATTAATGSETDEKTDGEQTTGGEKSTEDTEDENLPAETEKDSTPLLEGEYATLIENADNLKNTVTSYYTNGAREYYRVENMNMNFDYILTGAEDQLLTLTNKKGKTYVDSTMDVYVKMNTGKTYYASGSQASATANLYRYGYYYYDVHFYNQDFINEVNIVKEQSLKLAQFKNAHSMTTPTVKSNVLSSTINSAEDPYIYATGLKLETSKTNALRIP